MNKTDILFPHEMFDGVGNAVEIVCHFGLIMLKVGHTTSALPKSEKLAFELAGILHNPLRMPFNFYVFAGGLHGMNVFRQLWSFQLFTYIFLSELLRTKTC